MIALLFWGALTSIALFVRRCPRAALFLLILSVADGARLFLAPLRAGYSAPYVGDGLTLWLSTEIAPALLPPAVALALVGPRPRATLTYIALVGLVALVYPAVRGGELLGALGAIYVGSYGIAISSLLEEAAKKDPERLSRDALALLALLTTGIASVILIAVAGRGAWWAVTIPYGLGLVGAVAASLDVSAPRGARPQPRRRPG